MERRAQFARITCAIELVADERDATYAERRALDRFRTAVAAIECPTPRPNSGMRHPAAVRRLPRSGESTVLRLYQDIVLDNSGSNRDCSPIAQFADEFGEELAIAIEDDRQFTRPVQQSLCEATTHAIGERTWLLHRLQRETTALSTAIETLRQVETERAAAQQCIQSQRSFTARASAYDRLDALDRRCQELINN